MQKKKSQVTADLIEIFERRDAEGFNEFGRALEDRPHNILEEIEDAIEEAVDLCQYLMCLKLKVKSLLEQVNCGNINTK